MGFGAQKPRSPKRLPRSEGPSFLGLQRVYGALEVVGFGFRVLSGLWVSELWALGFRALTVSLGFWAFLSFRMV